MKEDRKRAPTPAKDEKKVIFYMFNRDSVCFLIPKKRGHGFLKVPAGHHYKKGDISSTIQHELNYSCSGLDGYLDVETGFHNDRTYPKLYKLLRGYYGFPVKQIDRSKWFDMLQKK